MNIINKILSRLKAEAKFVWIAFYTRYIYNRREAAGYIMSAPQGDFCDLAVVTFNNAKVVEYQIRTLAIFFTYPYRYTVFDNSTIEEKAKGIHTICMKYKVGYIRLPRQEFLPINCGSYSHGIACNYLYNKYIKHGGGSKYFGLLDHDIFPIKHFDVSRYLESQFFYGTKHRFYIWPGFCFLRMDYIMDKVLDFRPSIHLQGDTGACNAYSIFKNIDFSKFTLVKDEQRCFEGETDIFEGGYSYFDCGWIHCWNASNYMKKTMLENKMQRIYKMLDEALQA